MALNKVKTCICKGEKELKEGDKKAQILNNISSLALYKKFEDTTVKSIKLKDSSFKTLVLLVDAYLNVSNIRYSIYDVLRLHGYSREHYNNVSERLKTLVNKDLVVWSYNDRGVNVFYPSKKGIDIVYSCVL